MKMLVLMANCAHYIEYVVMETIIPIPNNFEVDCKRSSGLLITGIRGGKSNFAQVMSAKDECAFQPITLP